MWIHCSYNEKCFFKECFLTLVAGEISPSPADHRMHKIGCQGFDIEIAFPGKISTHNSQHITRIQKGENMYA